MTTPATHLLHHLSLKHLHPRQTWLSHFLTTQKPTTPLPALERTVTFRLLASDIRSSLRPDPPGSALPNDVLNAGVRERMLGVDVVCMVLDVEDVGRSKWGMVEGIEEGERGERTKGREVVRVVPGDEQSSGDGTDGAAGTGGGKGLCKLLLCDTAGVRVYAFEVESVEGVRVGMSVGAKVLLRKEAVVARGVVLLEPRGCVMLGGKVETLMKGWTEGRKQRLIDGIEAAENGGG